MVLKPSITAAATMASAPSTTLATFLRARALQLAEQHAPPQNANQRICVPQRKRNGKAHVANGKNGERVCHGPQHAGHNRDGDQVPVLGKIGEYLARALSSVGSVQRAVNTPATMHSEMAYGDSPVVTSFVGASAAPSQTPAPSPHNTPMPCAVSNVAAWAGVARCGVAHSDFNAAK